MLFQDYVAQLREVERVDLPTSSQAMKLGSTPDPVTGRERLALQVQGRPLLLEPGGETQLARRWDIPPEHFRRLPVELQAAELGHFAARDPKDLTLRATLAPGDAVPMVRAVLSGRYSPFDSAEVLEAIEPYVADMDIARPAIQRDDMALVLTRQETYDVSAGRQRGDMVKVGLTVRNNEVGEGSVGVEFGIWRLVCLNGAIGYSPEVSIRQRHMALDRRALAALVRNAVSSVADIGLGMVRQLEASHQVALPLLMAAKDPVEGWADGEKAQRRAATILRRHGAWTREARATIAREMPREGETLFGLVQAVTGPLAKGEPSLSGLLARERLAGELLALAD